MNTGVEAAYFGPAAARLFGRLHRPATPRGDGLALVLCNPFGFEEVCAHRALRAIARAAADAGVPALRFDYAGSGHSAGAEAGDEPDDMLPRWIASVGHAIDAVRQATGATRVVLLGVRLGALLAAAAAAGRDDVQGLVLVAPVARGRAYLRELTVLGATGSGAEGAPASGVESAGFGLSAATCAALSPLDLKTLPLRAGLPVVVVERDDLPDQGQLAAALTRAGLQARTAAWPGYASMAADPQRADVPPAIVAGVVATLDAWRAGDAPAATAAQPWGDTVLAGGDGPAWTESPVSIDTGAGTSLFGVLARPARARDGGPAVLMLNAGAVHSIGPNRLWVRLARRWAARGVSVLRLDLSGIGDSAPRTGEPDNVVYSRSAMADVAAALDWLRTTAGAGECHVMGLCSGAYHSFKAATTGLPVASALMINPLTYFWVPGTPLSDIKEYELVAARGRYRAGLFRWQTWQRLVRGDLDLRQIATVVLRGAGWAAWRRVRDLARALGLPLKDDLAGELHKAARAGRPLRFVFATDAPGCTLLHQQGGPAVKRLARAGRLSLDLVDGADHTFTRRPVRDHLVQQLDRLMLEACGLPPAAGDGRP